MFCNNTKSLENKPTMHSPSSWSSLHAISPSPTVWMFSYHTSCFMLQLYCVFLYKSFDCVLLHHVITDYLLSNKICDFFALVYCSLIYYLDGLKCFFKKWNAINAFNTQMIQSCQTHKWQWQLMPSATNDWKKD